MIPVFLKRENKPKEKSIFKEKLKEYMEHFGDGVITEPSTWTEEEWIAILDMCIKENKKLEEYIGEYDLKADY